MLVANRACIVVAALQLVLVSLLLTIFIDAGSKKRLSLSGSPLVPLVECNPYAIPGTLDRNHIWKPLFEPMKQSSICNPRLLSDNLAILKNQTAPLPSYLKNKLILLVGDSFDRKLVEDLCAHAGIKVKLSSLNGTIWATNGYMGSTTICTIKRGPYSFVLLSVFHFGVVDGAKGAWSMPKHWHVNYSPPLLKDRIQWLPYMLKSIARELFPSFCPTSNGTIDSTKCPAPVFETKRNDSTPHRKKMIPNPPFWNNEQNPFWFPVPNLIVAQSSVWDLKVMNQTHDGIADWARQLSSDMISPLTTLFGSIIKDVTFEANGEIHWFPSFLVRTTPLVNPTQKNQKYKNLWIHAMNNVLRSGALWRADSERNWGVLDWDQVTTGFNSWKDGLHPGLESNKAYLQMLLVRLEELEFASP
ncbi:hypothetical protein BDR26DRAFT_931062 [Obelidium mucronatum]|nr:hypothetical protein BDR26DRAFT_931062 [Obelidium mucronatum]